MPDKCYLLITEKLNIFNAFQACSLYGAQLADLQESVVERYAAQDSNLTFWFLKHYSYLPFGSRISLPFGEFKDVDFFKGYSAIHDFDDDPLCRISSTICSYYVASLKETADCRCSEKHAFFCWMRPSEPFIFCCLFKQFSVFLEITIIK